MSDPALSAMIREVLSEELAKLRPSGAKSDSNRESVSIGNDADLNAFARRFLAMMDDAKTRRAFEDGRLEFTLASPGQTNAAVSQLAGQSATEHRIDKGFLSERQIDTLPGGTKRLLVGKAVRLTPLARDRARHLGIVIERMEP